jgi:hypothetical protein
MADDPKAPSHVRGAIRRHARTAGVTAILALGALSVTTAPAAAASTAPAPAAAVICVPEAPVCAGIAGTAGAYRFEFRIQPVPPNRAFAITVNGAPTTGSVTTRVSGTTLLGEFRPMTALVSGDEVCLRIFGHPRQYCDTTP